MHIGDSGGKPSPYSLSGDEVSDHLMAVSRHLQDTNQKVELMELVTRIPDYVISEGICVELAASYRTLG